MPATAQLAYAVPRPNVIPLREIGLRSVPTLPTHCSSCNLRELCLPCGLSGQDVERADELIFTRKRVKRGETLYRAGNPFHSLYVLRSGFFKNVLLLEDGRDQVSSFYMPGEIMGLDAIGTGEHASSAVALEDSEVCAVPFAHLEDLGREMHSLQQHLHRMMSREIVRDHGIMVLLGSMRSEERLAAFLLNLSKRFAARGYSSAEFHLRMTREDIGSYLGMKLETVSRIFSKFQEAGLVSVQQRHIRILDAAGLKAVIELAVQ